MKVIFLILKYNILGFQSRISNMLYLPLHFGGISRRFLKPSLVAVDAVHILSPYSHSKRKTAPLPCYCCCELNVNI